MGQALSQPTDLSKYVQKPEIKDFVKKTEVTDFVKKADVSGFIDETKANTMINLAVGPFVKNDDLTTKILPGYVKTEGYPYSVNDAGDSILKSSTGKPVIRYNDAGVNIDDGIFVIKGKNIDDIIKDYTSGQITKVQNDLNTELSKKLVLSDLQNYYMNRTDLALGNNVKDRGDSGASRALVKDFDNNQLTINFGNDFKGGVKLNANGPQGFNVNGNTTINGNATITGTQFKVNNVDILGKIANLEASNVLSKDVSVDGSRIAFNKKIHTAPGTGLCNSNGSVCIDVADIVTTKNNYRVVAPTDGNTYIYNALNNVDPLKRGFSSDSEDIKKKHGTWVFQKL